MQQFEETPGSQHPDLFYPPDGDDLRLFPGPDSNVPLGEGDLIDILVRMVPTAWRELTSEIYLFR